MMSLFKEVFKRYEKKYLLTEEQYMKMQLRLKGLAKIDDYGKSTVCNVYFDTPDFQMIRNSLEKPVYKEKLRLRSYGLPKEEDSVFIEIKKKYKGIVYKRRVDMTLERAENYLYQKKPQWVSSQILGEVNWMFQIYSFLNPAMYISYDRIAMVGAEDSDLRITFDWNILWRQEDLDLSSGIWGSPLLQKEGYLLEIKIPGAVPLWLAHILDELHIYSVSFSKYGKAYENLLMGRTGQQERRDICA